MSSDRIDCLTDSQRAYLRLVFEHKSSKEIAQILGISAHTVDKRLKEAMRILGVNSRVDAARILASEEARAAVQPLGPQSAELAISYALGSIAPRALGGKDDRGSAVAIEEEQASFRAYPVRDEFPLPFPTPARPANTLSFRQRVGWTLGLIIGLALATGIMLSGLSALSSVVLALSH